MTLPASLIQSESGGNWTAVNNVAGSGGVGHFGRGQFSRGRLQDAMRAGVIPQGTSPEAFMASPDMQRAVEAWHVADIERFIRDNGLDRFVGANIRGQDVTPGGMVAVAHLGGNSGLRRYLESGGAYNPADAFGTRLSDYMSGHGGTGPRQNALSAPVSDRNALAMMAMQAMPQVQTNQLNAADFQTAPRRNAILSMMPGAY